MAKLGTVVFEGKSGNKYTFDVYEWGTPFKEGDAAVYFVTKRAKDADGTFRLTSIYVGETGNLANRFDNHHKQNCFNENGVNCVCILGETNEDTRLKIEADLIDNYNPPCNGD